MAKARMTTGERRARLGVRHALAQGARAPDPVAAARSVVAVHATDPASVYLSLAARSAEPSLDAVAAALYEERSLVRMLGMRRTMFVVPTALAPAVQAAATDAVAAAERRKLVKRLGDAGAAEDPDAWLAGVEEATLAALAARGEAAAVELSADVPALRTKVLMAAGRPYEAWQTVATWVLGLMAAEGRVVRGRPRGSWISSQYRWSPAEAWLSGGLTGRPAEPCEDELARRWLHAFGPAPVDDLRWWTGWPLGRLRAALSRIAPAEVDLDEGPGIALADDLAPTREPDPWIGLLPALDATPMGWSARGWFLGEHGPALFDRNGNVGPTAWCDGRIVGGWAQRADGEVAVRLLEDVGTEAADAIAAEAARLGALIGDARITPRFRTPLERELSSGL